MNIVIYTRTGCKYCDYLKKFMTDLGRKYTEKNISDHYIYAEEFQAERVHGVPLTIIDGMKYVGFSSEIKSLLKNLK
ncbi:glutaredoxin family protein [Bacillus sp. Marseille-P3800]|uniref:glutaredoxin family protein n=1 Tax=Bacillus sp. Marseille-P3800 TaxID=2014782 RepID=UPI00159BB584|nr:glutaredoxin family protein [Bacillus sp. Marseille-P3800]